MTIVTLIQRGLGNEVKLISLRLATTKVELDTSGDPRRSLEERYRTHDGYVQAVGAAARTQVKAGYLSQMDADTMINQAETSTVLR